ncbi:MAG: PhnD/SsuA/transferrin family substrate-binding protein, partial [Deferribacterales bacterium]
KLLIEEIKRNNIDIAYIGPLPYYEIKKYVQPLVVELEPDGKLSYRCVLFTTIDQDIKINPTTLNLALTNKHSTCGFLAAYHILKNYKIDIMKTRFSFIGPHVKVVEYILATKFNTGIVKESIFNKFKPVGLKSLAYSPDFPGFLIVVNPNTVPLKDTTAIKDKLLNLTDSEKKSLNFGKNGFAPFDKTHYNNLDTLIDDRIIRYINE